MKYINYDNLFPAESLHPGVISLSLPRLAVVLLIPLVLHPVTAIIITSAKEVMFSVAFVCSSVCKITEKVMNGF